MAGGVHDVQCISSSISKFFVSFHNDFQRVIFQITRLCQ